MTRTALALAAALFALTACGGSEEGGDASGADADSATPTEVDSGSADAEAARLALKEAAMESGSGLSQSFQLTEEQADCLAGGFVDEIGVESLQEYGILDADNQVVADAQVDDLSAEDADQLAGVLTGCVDVEALFEDQFSGQTGDLNEEQQQCINDAVDEDVITRVLSAQFQGSDGQEVLAGLQADLLPCLATPSE